jgi:hypothetical protein
MPNILRIKTLLNQWLIKVMAAMWVAFCNEGILPHCNLHDAIFCLVKRPADYSLKSQ